MNPLHASQGVIRPLVAWYSLMGVNTAVETTALATVAHGNDPDDKGFIPSVEMRPQCPQTQHGRPHRVASFQCASLFDIEQFESVS